MTTPQGQELAARLMFLARDYTTIVLATARSGIDTTPLAEEVESALNVLASSPGDGKPPQQYRILPGRGLLDDPETVAGVRAADAVVLVARRGRTARSDLEECRRELETAHIPLIAGVLVD